jgi:hypothetical protein
MFLSEAFAYWFPGYSRRRSARCKSEAVRALAQVASCKSTVLGSSSFLINRRFFFVMANSTVSCVQALCDTRLCCLDAEPNF